MVKGENKQSGQMTIEMMLLMTIFLAGSIFVLNQMKSQQTLASFVEGPWIPLKGMIEDGEWSKDSKELHPNLINRHASYFGDDAP